MNSAVKTFSFLQYYFQSVNRHALHAPFMYQMHEAVLRRDKILAVHREIEAVRKRLLQRNDIIPAEDYGAGSLKKKEERTLSQIVNSSSKSPRYARLLYRLVNYFKPAMMLELGTAAGISALYQCKGNPQGKLVTLEGNSTLAVVAAEVLKQENAEVIAGSFESILKDVLTTNKRFKYVFLDGNHRMEPLLRYFDQIFPFLDHEAVVVVDDINWSEEMQEAWKVLKADNRIQISADLFQLGLLFLRPGLSKQDFTIRY